MATNAVMETNHEPVTPVQRALGPIGRLAEFLKETRAGDEQGHYADTR